MSTVEKNKSRQLNFAEAMVLLVFFISFLIWGAMVGKLPTGMSVLICGVVAAAYGMSFLKISWENMYQSIQRVFLSGIGAILILLFVGVITGSWLAAGTTPMLIYYGLKMITPGSFLVVAFLLCSIVSMATGSGWSIIGSFGVALMGVALGLGINPAMAGAAIAAGSYLGDKWSPFSDVPNLCAAVTKGTSFDIFMAEIPTTLPGFLAAIVIYIIIGLRFKGAELDTSLLAPILQGLESTYKFNMLLLIPPIFVIGAGILKWPTLPSLFGSGLLGAGCGILIQGRKFADVFKIMYSGNKSATGIESLDKLLSGGGLGNMMSLILIIMCAFMFAGIIDEMGLLTVIMQRLSKLATSRGNLTLISAITTILGIYMSSSVYVSCIVNGRMWGESYERCGMDKVKLGQTLCEAGSHLGMVVPWSGGALIMMNTLGVSWNQYTPYLFNNWISLILLIVFAYMGKFNIPYVPEGEAASERAQNCPQMAPKATEA